MKVRASKALASRKKGSLLMEGRGGRVGGVASSPPPKPRSGQVTGDVSGEIKNDGIGGKKEES